MLPAEVLSKKKCYILESYNKKVISDLKTLTDYLEGHLGEPELLISEEREIIERLESEWKLMLALEAKKKDWFLCMRILGLVCEASGS